MLTAQKALLCAPAILLASCASQDVRQRSDADADRIRAVVQSIQASTRDRVDAEVPLYARVRGLWISERSTARSATDALPQQFSRPFVYRSMYPATLAHFAQTLSLAAGVEVRTVGEPLTQQAVQPIFLDHTGPLRHLVAQGAERFGVGFGWSDGALEIVQSEARIFPIQRSAVDARLAAEGAGTGPGANPRDPISELEMALKVISPTARVVVSRSMNSVTVVDRPRSMRDIERYMAHNAEQAGRTVMVRWQLINYLATQGGEAGAAISYVLNRGSGRLNITGGNTPDTAAGRMSFTLTDLASRATGSQVLLSLLNETGQATVVRDGLIPIQNNDTREYSETLRTPFPAKTTLAAIPNLGGGNVTNTQQVFPVTETAIEEIGLEMRISATIHPSEEVDLSVFYSLRELVRMVDFSTPLIRQEAPETAKRATTGLMRTRHGESTLFVMDNADGNSYDRRTGFQISESGKGRKNQWLLLLTPIITKGNV